jgi:hypothetical protein
VWFLKSFEFASFFFFCVHITQLHGGGADKVSFSITDKERFGLIFAKTGSIKSGTVFNVYYLGEQMTKIRGQQTSEVRNSLPDPERLLIGDE